MFELDMRSGTSFLHTHWVQFENLCIRAEIEYHICFVVFSADFYELLPVYAKKFFKQRRIW